MCVWPLGWHILLEGLQQESPFKRALLAVKLAEEEEEAESCESVMFPSSTPRPCRHTVSKPTAQSLNCL